MRLIHSIAGKDNMLEILKDGYLKSSKITKNVRMFVEPSGSKYIYLQLNKKNVPCNFILDENLLLENNFYLKLGWSGETVSKDAKLYKGEDYNKNSLKKLLKKFNNEVNLNNKGNKDFLMSNEIILKKKITLKKYLIKVNLKKNYDPKIIDYLKKNYPATKIIYPTV